MLRSTWGFYLNHGHQSLTLRLLKSDLEHVLIEHGEQPCGVLPFAFHLDLGCLLETQEYLGLLSEPCSPIQTF